jgi:hypothetical protein
MIPALVILPYAARAFLLGHPAIRIATFATLLAAGVLATAWVARAFYYPIVPLNYAAARDKSSNMLKESKRQK